MVCCVKTGCTDIVVGAAIVVKGEANPLGAEIVLAVTGNEVKGLGAEMVCNGTAADIAVVVVIGIARDVCIAYGLVAMVAGAGIA
jgi:hypothetical protein